MQFLVVEGSHCARKQHVYNHVDKQYKDAPVIAVVMCGGEIDLWRVDPNNIRLARFELVRYYRDMYEKTPTINIYTKS